jgi:UDP-glucose 4-epimerase
MRIVITGMGGDIGTGVALRFDGDPLVSMLGIDMAPPRRRIRNAEFHRVPPDDVERRAELIRDFDPHVLLHLGVYEPHSRSKPNEAVTRTRAATRSVFQAALDCPSLEHVVVRSGIEVYGRERGTPLRPREDALINPTTRFGKSLAEVEDLARAFGTARDVPVTLLRFAPIVGPYIPSPLGRFLRLPVVPVAVPVDAAIQLVHIDDVHDSFLAAVRARVDGAFNIVGDGAVTGSQAARIGGRVLVPVIGPGWILARAATAALGSPLPEHAIEAMRRGRTADGSRAQAELDFTPARSTRACVENLYEWATVTRLDVDRSAA